MRIFYVLAASASLALGGGCVQPERSTIASIPILLLETPAQNSKTTESMITLQGKTDAVAIIVNGKAFDIDRQRFHVPVELAIGQNTFELAAGNGFSTTTMTLRIERTRSL